MTKDEFATALEKAGYKPVFEDGIIIVLHTEKENSEVMTELKKIAEKNDFHGSFGCRKITAKND